MSTIGEKLNMQIMLYVYICGIVNVRDEPEQQTATIAPDALALIQWILAYETIINLCEKCRAC